MPAGRPTDYDPKYCDLVIELASQGKSKAQMAATIGVTRKTMWTWAQQYPEFLNAFELAEELCQQWWENIGQTYLVNTKDGDSLNTGLWARSMAARFPKDYTDRTKHEVTGKDEGPIQIDHVVDVAQSLIDELTGLRQNADSKAK
ncbi:MAG: hypothetical protein EBR82_73520 [Caulobacteraceae bacterium]|jgi:DNA-binding XRE family transcriptional regulator|nr:hypothetical protein [Caulobacteraceae bacterium]